MADYGGQFFRVGLLVVSGGRRAWGGEGSYSVGAGEAYEDLWWVMVFLLQV